jgi:Rieske 2Fe-2S family protein
MSYDDVRVRSALASTKPGFSLPGGFYQADWLHAADLDLIWHREWIFIGHDCEIAAPGAYLTVQIGRYSVIVVRDQAGGLHAHHNACRHRGFKLCEATRGEVKRRFVCPYHQWSYDLDGRLSKARDLTGKLDPREFGLKPAHVASLSGSIFVCVAERAPDIAPLRALTEPYLAPFDLQQAKVAHESRMVEHGNWKLVMENNRECYHCAGSHPELCRTFPDGAAHSGGGTAEEKALMAAFEARCRRLGFESAFRATGDFQTRIMRMPFVDGARSMTMTGQPAVAKRLGRLPQDDDVGDVLLYHFPSTWNHFTADHAVTFRILPLSPTSTELVTKWLVPKAAIEGVDYDLTTLTEVWQATNAQDTALVERNQRGVSSPAYEPGPYSPTHEEGIIQFIAWYTGAMQRRLDDQRRAPAAAE